MLVLAAAMLASDGMDDSSFHVFNRHTRSNGLMPRCVAASLAF
jgi:hypothetical protein